MWAGMSRDRFVGGRNVKAPDYSGRPKYSAHLPKEGHILGGIFPHTAMLESSGFFSLKDLCLGNNTELKTFKYL